MQGGGFHFLIFWLVYDLACNFNFLFQFVIVLNMGMSMFELASARMCNQDPCVCASGSTK